MDLFRRRGSVRLETGYSDDSVRPVVYDLGSLCAQHPTPNSKQERALCVSLNG